jgi:hypothetical protein
VWRGVKKEEGNNNTQKEGEERFEGKGDIFTIKMMDFILMEIVREWKGRRGSCFFTSRQTPSR